MESQLDTLDEGECNLFGLYILCPLVITTSIRREHFLHDSMQHQRVRPVVTVANSVSAYVYESAMHVVKATLAQSLHAPCMV